MRVSTREAPIAEREIQAQVLQGLAMLGIEVQRQNTGAAMNPKGRMVRFGRKGNLDISGTLPDGRRLEIEVKRRGKRPTAAQWDRIRRLNATGAVAFWTNDAERCLCAMRRIIQDGWRVGFEPDGLAYVTDEAEET